MIGLRLVRWWIARNPMRFKSLRAALIATRAGVTLEQYLIRALIVGLVLSVFSGMIGGIAGFSLFRLNLGLKPELYNVLNVTLSSDNSGIGQDQGMNLIISFIQIIMAIFPAIIGFIIGYSVFLILPSLSKRTRETRINLGLHNAVSYMFAMRRGGAEVLIILRSISEMSAIYGDVALEFRQIVRDCDFFGYDVINAMRHLGETSPSQKLRDFLQDLVSTVESGGDITRFLQDRIKTLQEEAKFEQKEFLQFLAMVAEIYVTIFIAGPLFLITILVVMGMMGSSAILELAVMGYIVLPIGSALFILMIDSISLKEETAIRFIRARWLNQYNDVRVIKKTGEELFFTALLKFDKARAIKKWLENPFQSFIEKPELTFLFTIPISIIYLIFFFFQIPTGEFIEKVVFYDEHIMIALLISLFPFAYFNTLWNKKIRGIEAMIPDFLERMAGINEVGLTLTQSIAVMARANLGLLAYEIRHIQRDIQWGANFSEALIRFEKRVRTALIARTVTLITKAATMSSSISDLLRIAASDARMSELLKRERFSEMFIYTAVVYLSFFVFIFVIGVITTQFLAVLAAQDYENLQNAGPLSGLGTTSLSMIDMLLYHTCLIQGLCSGLIAGLIGESSLKAGVKHACVLIMGALLAFNFAF